MRRITSYIVANLQMSMKVWEKGDVPANIINAISVGAIAGLAVLGIDGIAPPGVKHALEIGLAGWFAVLLLAITPYRMWSAEKDRVEKFEEAAKPKLKVSEFFNIEPKGATGDGVVAKELRLKIYNNSTSVVKNCHVRMHSFVNVSGAGD